MKIEFVNHSSFIVEQKNTRIMCDPWLEGSVFNNGWNLISPTVFSYSDFASVNYIWFSHEHPDHFYPPNLKKIPAELRAQITILFQFTLDKRVADWCRKQGFKKVIELHPGKWEPLSDGIRILCEHFDEGDSWICFKTETETFLNTNDCGITSKAQAEKIKSKTGSVDILLTQFSYAYWAGNPDQVEYRRKVAMDKLGWMKQQCDVFKPSYVIPIASYIYFSHVENQYLNDEINTPAKTAAFLKQHTTAIPVVLYNGDVFETGTEHDSLRSISAYEKDMASIRERKLYHQTNVLDEQVLMKQAADFLTELNKNNSFHLKSSLKPALIFLRDYNKAFSLSLGGFTESNSPEESCDVSSTSENLSFCFLYPYGLDTTQINGRLTKPVKGNYTRFYNFFRINQLKSRGIDPNRFTYLIAAVKRKILFKLGLYKP
jgi:UDP-MurNAc hydroxylase